MVGGVIAMKSRPVIAMAVLLLGLLLLAQRCPNGTSSPVAIFTVDVASGTSPLEVTFDASGSYDPDGTIISYSWDFGDGATGTGPTATHTFTTPSSQTFVVTLAVTDDDGKQGTASQEIAVEGHYPEGALFFDDFEDGADPAWIFPSGNWEVQAGQLHLADLYDSDQTYGYVTTGYGWTDYVVEADIAYEYPYSGRLQGLVVRARDDVNKVVLWGDATRLYFDVYVNGERILYRAAEVEAGWPNTCRVSVRVEGDSYKVYIDDTLQTELTDSTFLSGTAGVALFGAYGKNHEGFRFDNFTVRGL